MKVGNRFGKWGISLVLIIKLSLNINNSLGMDPDITQTLLKYQPQAKEWRNKFLLPKTL